MMRNGKNPSTQREKAASRELSKIAKETSALLCPYEPRNLERLREITERSRVLLPMIGWDVPDEEVT